MSNQSHYFKARPVKVLFVIGLSLAFSPVRLPAQYVSTLISNTLSAPAGVAQDNNNNVYVTDSGNDRILEYVPSTTNLSTLAGTFGVAGSANGTNGSALFNNPQGIVFARGGLVVVDSDNQELRFVSLAGVVTNLAGAAGSPGFANGPALGGAQFSYPAGIAADNASNLYIADQGNNKIRILSAANVVSTIGANHVFSYPSAVAVDLNTNIWVTDTGNQQICMISNGVTYVEAGTRRAIGTNDTSLVNHTGPLFNLPAGLFWDSVSNVLVISDTGNNTIRQLYWTNYQGINTNVVQTITGQPGVAGFANGALGASQFNQPAGICLDTPDSGYYIVDTANNAVRVLQPTQPPPPPQPISVPQIGYITYPASSGNSGAQFNAITEPISVFNNVVNLSIEQDDPTVETFISYGDYGTFIPTPSTSSLPITAFTAADIGLPAGDGNFILNLNISPDMVLDAVSIAPGRPTSPVATTRLQFVTANPYVIGTDAADLLLSNITVGAQMYYAMDNSTNIPTNDGSYGIGPVTSGTVLSLQITSNVNFKIRAFSSGFAPSATVTVPLSYSNFIGNQITFGFASGLASSHFITAPGRHFYAPVTLTELPATTIYAMQFDLTESGTNYKVDTNTWHFGSTLMQPLTNGILTNIPPSIVVTNGNPTNFYTTNGVWLETNGLMGVAWITLPPQTNLYPTPGQDLTAYSLVDGYEFTEAGNAQAVIGHFSFFTPTNAAPGNQYTIQIELPSASTYSSTTPSPPIGVFLQATTNGSLSNGAINAIKQVTVSNTVSYLVGDAFPLEWFNAGDFGDYNLQNDDVMAVYQTAIGIPPVGGINGPPINSDLYDAMDSASGAYNLYDANDSDINSITNGDGILDVNDVYVTLRRSLDTNLIWWIRNWGANGVFYTQFTNFTVYSGVVPAVQPQSSPAAPRYISVAADQVQATGGNTIEIPIRVLAADSHPIRVMMMNVEVDPLDGSPAITSPVSLTTSGNFNAPTISSASGPNNCAAAWLDSTVAGLSGTNILATLTVTLPSNVTTNSAYRVHFDHFSASPNGLALFVPTVQDGLITVGSRTNSSWGDGIPDTWRLLWFGTVSNALSAANADPDGDGANNWQEFIAGTNPNDSTSVFQFAPGEGNSSSVTLQWPSVVNKSYSVQTSRTLFPPNWVTVATNLIGTGQIMQWQDNNPSGKGQFYRATVH